MRVLLVEDDFAISQSIETMLKKEGMIVDTTDLGEEGFEITEGLFGPLRLSYWMTTDVNYRDVY